MKHSIHLALNGETIPIILRKNAQAKRIILRVDGVTGDVKITLPKRSSEKAAEKFLFKHLDWVAEERSKISLNTITHNSLLKVNDVPLTVKYTGVSPRKILVDNGDLLVGGPLDLAPKRLEKWLKEQAKIALDKECKKYADTLNVQYDRISIGDMKSRWGSCSSSGTLRFNWRLLLAPETVLSYVAAHEVAHLIEMNHSDRFWSHVHACMPSYREHRVWLKKHGNELFRYVLG